MKYYPSYWERSVILKPFDFIVLGAGLIGKQIAIKIKLKYPGCRIALVDRYPVPMGASTRNAGFACFGSLTEILDDLNRSSINEVMALIDKRYRGIRKLVDEFGKENIGYYATGSAEVFAKDHTNDLHFAVSKMEEINKEIKNCSGLEKTFQLNKDQQSGMNVLPTSISNPYEGMLNSGMLNETIAYRAHHLGILPFYGFNVKEISNTGSYYELRDESEMTLKCGQLIIANNAFVSELMPELDVVPARGQVIITKPLENIPFNGIFHSDKGYVYFRNIDNRVLIGGGRNHFEKVEQTHDLGGSDDLRQFLENYLRTVVLPGRAFETDMHWAGIMAMGKEKLPIVKRLNERLLVCVRMSGMGVALGPVLSDEVSQMV